MEGDARIWPKRITVDKRIVEILSGSTYENFPKALKEVITNSYDADATEVKVLIDPRMEQIKIEDNGKGMDEADLDFYLRIAGKTRGKATKTIRGRVRIGRFGVGFLSVFPFCKTYEIETTKSGSDRVIRATIPCGKYFTKEGDLKDVDQIPIQGGVRQDRKKINVSYTVVKLTGFTKITHAFFNEEYNISGRRNTVLRYKPVDRLVWEFSEDLPLNYANGRLNEILKIGDDKFDVYLNNRKGPLRRNVYSTNILDSSGKGGEVLGSIKFRFFIGSNFEPVSPVEGRYLKIRNVNVGVGERETFGIGLEGKLYAKLAHITGEIQVEEGLNELITVSRDKFNFSPDYEEFKEYFRQKLRYWATELEQTAKLESLSKDIRKEGSLKALKTTGEEGLRKQIESLEKRGYKVKKGERVSSTKSRDRKEIVVDRVNKEIHIAESFDEITREILIDKKKYRIKISDWDYQKDVFKGCKFKRDLILINRKYPLFRNDRYYDLLVKSVVLFTYYLRTDQLKLDRAYDDFENLFDDYK